MAVVGSSGFSYDSSPTDLGVTNEYQMAANMFEFLQNWSAPQPPRLVIVPAVKRSD
jgi:hypothetical protein